MNNSIETIKKFVGSGGTPQEFIMKAMGSNNNPMLNNLIQIAKNGNSKDIEMFARNLFKEKGRNFDEEFSQFMKNFK